MEHRRKTDDLDKDESPASVAFEIPPILRRTVCEPSVAVHLFWVVSHSFELVIFELPGIRV